MHNPFFKDYFNFSRNERIGTLIIVALILILIVLPFFYPLFGTPKQERNAGFEDAISRLKTGNADSLKENNYSKNFDNELYDDYTPTARNKYEPIKAELFYFDPNIATAGDWKRLGIRDKTIHTIQNYISKGGKFYKPEDIGKIWGLAPKDVQRLTPYVSIKKQEREFVTFEKKEFTKTAYPSKSVQPIDVNLADTSAYISLPGIGSKLSQRIIAFREKLGGFYSVEQVGETYFLPDSTFQKIKPRLIIGDTKVRQININTASVDEMKVHPYLRYNVANAIFQFRNQHGNFVAVEDIKKIMLVTDEVFQKVAPYLSIQ